MHATNGASTSTPASGSPLTIFRCEAGQEAFIRTLSPSYGGLFTHYLRNRSWYCAPDGCFLGTRCHERQWKGYFVADVYDKRTRKWRPFLIELTEHAELDVRGRYQRGQMWRMFRLPQPTKKKTPVTMEYLEEVEAKFLPPTIDYVPLLMTVFHVERIAVDVKNPMPARTMVEAVEGPPPPGLGGSREPIERPTAEQLAAAREAFRPTVPMRPATNGHPGK